MASSADDLDKKEILYNEYSIRNNGAMLEYSRTSMSALSGGAAGILGFTGLIGFLFYFISSFVLSIILWLKIGSDWNRYFISKWSILTNGLFGGLFTYVLFWTFLYGMVHVY